jgi:serine/threonine-protein kinase
VLGQGGMAIVLQAMHLHLQQSVAIKLVLPEILQSPELVKRFLREARAMARLRGEHVARVLDVGALETGIPYMILEYLEGTDLACVPHGQLTIGGLVDLVLQACEALGEAHALGIVHRDIKPENLFITRRLGGTPLLKLLDFGISKASAVSARLTLPQAMLGTPAYMSPEQMRSPHDVDHRSDIWSLGIVLYERLAGELPFESCAFSSTVLKAVNEPLPELPVQLPFGLDDVVYRCLEKTPARRFQSITELAVALAPYAASLAQAAITLHRLRALGAMPHAARAPATATGATDHVGSAVAPPGDRRTSR